MILPEIITDAIISFLDLKSVLVLYKVNRFWYSRTIIGLKYLDTTELNIISDISFILSKFNKIQTLITQKVFHSVELKALKVLEMHGIDDENTDFTQILSKSKALQELGIYQSINYQNDNVLTTLATLPCITVLEIDQAYDISNIGLNRVLSECKALKDLTIINCPGLDKDVFINITNLNLYTLNLSKCRLVCNDFINSISIKCLNLRYLDISNDSLVSKVDYLSDLPRLSSLVVSGCYLLNDQSFANFKSGNLKELDISFCTSVTDVGLSHVLDNCQGLTSINLREASGISLNGIDLACKSRNGLFYGSILEFNHV